MMTTIAKESIELMLTTTTTESSSSTTTTTTESSTITTTEPLSTFIITAEPGSTTTEADLISLDSTDRGVYAIYQTKISKNSQRSAVGNQYGSYPPDQSPDNACDGNHLTKYLNFGMCFEDSHGVQCGLDTGFFLELKRGASLVTGLQICTAEDFATRDPLMISLEGSNEPYPTLILGPSWTLIYNGPSGLQKDPGRLTCGIVQLINNSAQYKSYRFLVSGKRNISNSVQYSELKLFGH
ncbi:unnamed protein product [Adineta steineri]|uniref:Uncharacterized protein n=1 Tax=Adineta steineri TaxID=433720 RepID=A0A819LKA6_9BILA|nr:unnamed protein product [Adineta steineri]CAF3962424.1 unnamed protein product [Adineta steineri]